MTVFIDIETVPAGERPGIDALKVPGTMSKAETIEKWWADTEAREADLDNLYRKRALSYTEGRILAVAYAIEKGPVQGFLNDDEETLLKEVEASLLEYDSALDKKTCTLVGHNAKNFDFPYLALRAYKYRLPTLASMFRVPNPFEFLKDTMAMYCFTDRKGMVSLKTACAFFGIQAKDDMDGSMVYDEYLAGNREKIRKYCMQDVENLRKLYIALTFGEIREMH